MTECFWPHSDAWGERVVVAGFWIPLGFHRAARNTDTVVPGKGGLISLPWVLGVDFISSLGVCRAVGIGPE